MESPVIILIRSLLAASAALVIVSSAACGAASAPPLDLHERVDVSGQPPVEVRVHVQPEHRRDADRYLRAAVGTLRLCEEWAGPLGHDSLTIVDSAWHSTSGGTGDTAMVAPAPWWTTRTVMAPEILTARAVSFRYWSALFDASPPRDGIIDMLEDYVVSRAVTPLFELDNNPPGYAFLEGRYFGDFVPRFVRIRVLPETLEDPSFLSLTAARERRLIEHALVWPTHTRMTLMTLERWLGRPVFDQVVAEFVRTSRGGRPTETDFERIASEVSGQNLTWFFDQTVRSNYGGIDYGVEHLASDRQADGSYLTTVVARRYGEEMFTGSSAPRVGSFERGRGVTLRVTFADGARTVDHWDGRDGEKTFSYRSPAAAVSAEVDPERILVLDWNRTNNSRTLAPQTAATATRWAARWMIWMQDLMLTYASLV